MIEWQERSYVRNYVFFQCPAMCQPLDSATPGRPPNVPFLGRERYVFMFLCEKNCAYGHGLSPAALTLKPLRRPSNESL
jgi:hypothetical protein